MPIKGPQIIHNNDGTVNIAYKPTESGSHEMSLLYNEQTVDGTPFHCHVDHGAAGFVTAYGEGLNQGLCGKEASFTIVGGGKDVDFKIEGPNKAEVKKNELKGNTRHVTFVPISPGEYFAHIKHKGKEIHGSPFSVKITGGEGRKRSQVSLTGTSEISLGGQDVDLANMVGVMKTPSGNCEPVLLKKMSDGRLGMSSFSPKSKGNYTVDVTQDGKGIRGSPFKIAIDDSKVACAGKVHVDGQGVKDVHANQWNEFSLDINDAGYGSIAMSVEGPHRSDIEHSKKEDGVFNFKYRPHEPGMYLLNIRFADDHVTGSPYMLNVVGESSGRVRETKTCSIRDADIASPGHKCEFQLKIPGTNPLDMEAVLTTPNGKSDLCAIKDLDDSLYDIHFKPEMEGVHTVSLKHKGLHISGSPFQYTVGDLKPGGPHKVEIGGPGLERGEVGAWNDFNVYTREAGGGQLAISIEGPSKAEIKVTDRGHGYTTVSYKVTKQGDYGVHVKYDDMHTPDSPAQLFIAPESGDAKKVCLSGLRDRGLDPGKPVTFNVSLCGAKGELSCNVDTPDGQDQEVFMQEMDQELYAIRFVPREAGVYYVSVRFNEAHVPGSPIPMLIGKMGADPALVLASGDGLKGGICGSPCKFNVKTTNSGSGVLNCHIEGPSKVAISCTEVDEGYDFTYVPMAAGDYLISIKYCNVTLAGMPTIATVTGGGEVGSGKKAASVTEASSLVIETVEKVPGASKKKKFVGDASKIVTRGNGLKKAFMGRPANFSVDTKNAGQAFFSVGMIGPGGAPPDELSYKKQRQTVYQVTYKPNAKGDNTMYVRWGDDDIPGSPFTISVG